MINIGNFPWVFIIVFSLAILCMKPITFWLIAWGTHFVYGAIPYRQLTLDDLGYSRHRFAFSSITPKGFRRSNPKTDLPYGDHEDLIDTKIDNIPVHYRTEILNEVINGTGRDTIRRLHSKLLKLLPNKGSRRDEYLKTYFRFLVGSTYLEIELLRIFLRYMYVVKDCHDSTDSFSALSMVDEMRAYGESKWNTSMDFLSPRMMIDWSRQLKIPGLFRVDIAKSELTSFQANSPITPRTLLSLHTLTWKSIFRDRLHRLTLTGYENID